ncbi:hypothetical protein [Natrinema salsiterrestre]|uniref:DUF8119 domain-containing protein n=1 Tax=Natrinema salsiterrestre TaxID=2950540 RepID=A0A9Q4Q2F8_9EURY|nr:hypothetical protein [Natrinema salsiterrestre]MDF9745218.1 hypothetical protein [Natrinema salsiterrestre]
MSNDTTRATETESGRTPSAASAAVSGILRLLLDLLAVSLWVLLLTLLFLETAWPRWAFYALLVAGVGVYVTVTAAWIRPDEN